MDALGENHVGVLSDGGSIPLTSTKENNRSCNWLRLFSLVGFYITQNPWIKETLSHRILINTAYNTVGIRIEILPPK